MESFFSALSTAAHGMHAQSTRLRVTSENIANADTPGYHRKMVSFDQVATEAGLMVRPGPISLDQTPAEKVFDPGHPLADDRGYYTSSNVDLMVEIGDAREAQRTYEANMRMFDQARKMAASFLEFLRR